MKGNEKKNSERYNGHEIRLAHWLREKKLVKLAMNNGCTINAYIGSFDRFTVTVQPEGTVDRDDQVTVFKHAIASMNSVTPSAYVS